MSAAFTNPEFGKPPSEMEDLLQRVAQWMAHKTAPPDCRDIEDTDAATNEGLLRESGLLRLLEAGQAMRDGWLFGAAAYQGKDSHQADAWDAALAEMKEKLNG